MNGRSKPVRAVHIAALLAALLMPVSSLTVVLSSSFTRTFARSGGPRTARAAVPAGTEA
jgi:Na+/proline symporter